jgi:hypothetical protein
MLFAACQKQVAETDNVPQPAPTCNDGVRNQGETDIDCGGPCPACRPVMLALINNDSFTANQNTIVSYSLPNAFYMTGSSNAGSISIILPEPLALGNFSNAQGLFISSLNGKNYISSMANLSISNLSFTDSTATGSFDFEGISPPNDTALIKNGSFERMSFKKQ